MKTNKFIKLMKEYNFIEFNKGSNSKHRKFTNDKNISFMIPHSSCTKEVDMFYVRRFKKLLKEIK